MAHISLAGVYKEFNRPVSEAKSSDRLSVLQDVSMCVAKNEFVSILGPSGCGKSTLLRLMAGLDSSFSGTVLMDSVNVKEARLPVCYMLQKDCLMPWRTLLENVMLPAEIAQKDLKAVQTSVIPMIEEFGLSGFEHYRPNELSGGMRQRAALLRTYLMEGDIMLLDEPFGALDEITRMQMQDWLLKVWEKHRKTVVFITHDIDEAVFLSDRVLVMSKRPGTLTREIKIGFPRPRTRDMLVSNTFLDYKKDIMVGLV